MLVFAATPLIYLAKAGKLRKLEEVEEKKVVPASVYKEVVEQGKESGQPDARKIEKLVEAEIFLVREVEDNQLYHRLKETSHLSHADRKALCLAKEKGGTAIIDEEHARTIADVEEIDNRGTIYLLFRLLDRGSLSPGTGQETLDGMIAAGWYCSTDLYSQILDKLEQFSA